jgi:hypothetical protein
MEAIAASSVVYPLPGSEDRLPKFCWSLPIDCQFVGEMQCSSEVNAGEAEQPCPECAGEDRVTIADDRAWNSMQLDDVVEECSGHRNASVQVVDRMAGHKDDVNGTKMRPA